MKKGIILIVYLAALFGFSSCENNLDNAVEGFWSIDTLYYKDYDVLDCMLSNLISFKNDEVDLPSANHRCDSLIKKSLIEFGTWEVIKSGSETDSVPFRIKIDTKNEVFSGTHKIMFFRDEVNRLLKMEIWSDSLYMVCRKGLFDYDKNKKLVYKLERITWPANPDLK